MGSKGRNGYGHTCSDTYDGSYREQRRQHRHTVPDTSGRQFGYTISDTSGQYGFTGTYADDRTAS